MRTIPHRMLSVLAAASALSSASVVLGQIPAVNNGVGAAGNAGGNLGVQRMNNSWNGASAINSTGSINGASSANGAARATDNSSFLNNTAPKGAATTDITGRDSIGSQSGRIDAQTDGTGSLRAGGAGINGTGSASMALNTAQTIPAVQTAAFTERDRVTADLRGKMEASEKAVTQLKHRSGQMSAEAKADLKQSIKNAEAREKDLKKSLKAASKAKADTWEDARASVATNYNLYADAVAQAEAASSAK